jgi:outer membrane protein assembly factor BamE
MNKFQRIFLGMALTALASGCVYRINIQQGNFLDQAAVEQVKAGMTRSQVRYLLGTPMVADSFNKERWDYIYYLKKGSTNRRPPRRRRRMRPRKRSRTAALIERYARN